MLRFAETAARHCCVVAALTGFEPVTLRVADACSIQRFFENEENSKIAPTESNETIASDGKQAVRPRMTTAPAMHPNELPVPIGDGLVARVPFPMTEEDFELLIGTLQLWKKKLVKPSDGSTGAS